MAPLRITALVALGALAAATAVVTATPASADAPAPSAPCYNGITPMNPYVDNCGIPNRPPRVLGSAPDQTAILNCSVGGAAWRAVCLSQFVNGGPYPGFAIGVG
ncbi:MAG: hypothetical protein ACOYEV_19305 [Candidatus Nanopelagicales bacterium]